MNGSIINFVETPKEVSVDISSKKAKLSSRSFALIKKAASKIRESLARKMEAQKVELAKQYQEAHETVREEAQNQNTKNRNEYDGDRLQRLTNALGSIGVKLILSDYAASRLSVYGQPKAIKMPNFWSNIKDTLSNAHMVDREYKDIGRAFKYGGSERGIEGLDSMYKMMNESKNIQNPEKREAPVQEPVQPKVPEQPKSGINIDDYLKNFDPQQPSIEATNKEVDAQLAETEAGINDRFSQMMSNLGGNEHEQENQMDYGNRHYACAAGDAAGGDQGLRTAGDRLLCQCGAGHRGAGRGTGQRFDRGADLPGAGIPAGHRAPDSHGSRHHGGQFRLRCPAVAGDG